MGFKATIYTYFTILLFYVNKIRYFLPYKQLTKDFRYFNGAKLCWYWFQLQATVLNLFPQSNLGKKRSELKHLIKERAKKLEEIKQSIKVIKVSHLKV